MAEVVWKDIIWTGVHRERSIRELLTILKGYGATEILKFEKPGHYSGELALWLDESGIKHITLFHLEVIGKKRRGLGRQALSELRNIFGGGIYVLDPGEETPPEDMAGGIHVQEPNRESAMFWLKMFEEELIQSVEGDLINLDENTSPDEVQALKRKCAISPDDSQQSRQRHSDFP
jgi:hypothetical protein